MPKYRFKGYEGTFEGDTPEEAWAKAQASQQPDDRSFADSAKRGVGLATRATAFAPAKTTASLADLAAGAVNAFLNTARPLGAEKREFLPTGSREYLEGRLDRFLPTPTGTAERAADLGGEALFTGGPAGIGLGQARNLPAATGPVLDMVLPRGFVGRRLGLEPRTVPASVPGRPAQTTITGPQRELASQIERGTVPAGATPSSVTRAGDATRSAGTLGDEIGRMFVERPRMAAAGEFGGGAGAVALSDIIAELGGGPEAQFAATMVGGVTGGAAPQVFLSRPGQITGLAKRIVEPLTGNVDAATVPERISGGAGRRAAQELQRRADDPVVAAEAARTAPEGVTPARATGDPELMALESRVLDDNRQLAGDVRRDLQAAEARTVRDLVDDLPDDISRQDWQHQVVQRAAPEGAVITRGEPDEMLQQANRAFQQSYDEIRGYPMHTRVVRVEGGDIPMGEHIAGAASLRDDFIAEPKWRKNTGNNILNLYTDMVRAGENGLVDSADLLRFRSALRSEVRARRNPSKPRQRAERRMYQEAVRRTTEVLESQLPDDAARQLRNLDLRYRDMMTVEDAAFRSREGGLTPERLRTAIGQRENRGAVARGQTGDLARMAEQGRDITPLFNANRNTDDEIRRVFRTMDDETAQATRAGITRHLVRKAQLTAGESNQLHTPGDRYLSGRSLMREIEQNASRLRAAGFTDADIGRMERIADRLVTIQRSQPRAAEQLVDDALGAATRLLSGMAAAKATQRVTRSIGTGGTGSLMFGGAVRRTIQDTVKFLSVDGAQKLLTDAMTDPELFSALLTRSTAPAIQQVRANRIMNAWLAQNENVFDEPEEE